MILSLPTCTRNLILLTLWKLFTLWDVTALWHDSLTWLHNSQTGLNFLFSASLALGKWCWIQMFVFRSDSLCMIFYPVHQVTRKSARFQFVLSAAAFQTGKSDSSGNRLHLICWFHRLSGEIAKLLSVRMS